MFTLGVCTQHLSAGGYILQYTIAFERAWDRLTKWVASGKFAPQNEEDIQCFLFHGVVVELGTARGVRTKASRGNLWLGTKHFPDLVLGLDPYELSLPKKNRPT